MPKPEKEAASNKQINVERGLHDQTRNGCVHLHQTRSEACFGRAGGIQ